MSFKLASEATDTRRYTASPSLFQPNTFSFKLEDGKGRMHRFICGMYVTIFSVYYDLSLYLTNTKFIYWTDIRSLAEVMASILQRVGNDIDRNNLPQILVHFYWLCFIFLLPKPFNEIGFLLCCSTKMKIMTTLLLHQMRT